MRYLLSILLLLSVNSWAQISAVGIAFKQSTGGYAVATTTTTVGATSIHVGIGYYQFTSSAAVTVVDNDGAGHSSTWVQDTVVKLAGDAAVISFHCSTCYTSATHTFSVNTGDGVTAGTRQYPAIGVLATSGEVAAGAKDKATGKTSSSSSLTGTSLTPSANNSLVIAIYNGSSTSISTTPSGYTIIGSASGTSNSAGLYFGYKVQSSASAETPAWTLGSSNSQVEITTSFLKSIATFLQGGIRRKIRKA